MIGGKSVLALVPARGGSRRLPGKNIRPFDGRPLIAWTIAAARASVHVDRVVVSSDDSAIIAAALAAGGEAPFTRPPELATDEASSMDVIFHALAALGKRYDYLVLLQPTSPLRLAADIDACLAACETTGAVSSVSVADVPKPGSYFGRIGESGAFAFHDYFAGEARPCLLNGAIYVSRVDHLMATRSFYDASTRAHLMPAWRSIDIDDENEFAAAEAIHSLRRRE